MSTENKLEAPRAIAAELRRMAGEGFSVEADQAMEAAAAIDELIGMVDRRDTFARQSLRAVRDVAMDFGLLPDGGETKIKEVADRIIEIHAIEQDEYDNGDRLVWRTPDCPPPPGKRVLIKYEHRYGKWWGVGVHIPPEWREDEIEWDSYDFLVYSEKQDKYFWPEGWYLEGVSQDCSGYHEHMHDKVIAWAPIPSAGNLGTFQGRAELIYLASPYTSESVDVMEERWRDAMQASHELREAGYLVYSPIAETHPIAVTFGAPVQFEFWRFYNMRMLAACDAIVVLRLDGWEQSVGVAAELERARELGMRVGYVDLIMESGDAIMIEWENE